MTTETVYWMIQQQNTELYYGTNHFMTTVVNDAIKFVHKAHAEDWIEQNANPKADNMIVKLTIRIERVK